MSGLFGDVIMIIISAQIKKPVPSAQLSSARDILNVELINKDSSFNTSPHRLNSTSESDSNSIGIFLIDLDILLNFAEHKRKHPIEQNGQQEEHAKKLFERE